MWFNRDHIIRHKEIPITDLQGYILPHASTKFTGSIISHCLRFRPSKSINTIMILYAPSHSTPNVVISPSKSYYHEYYVPQQCLEYIFGPTIQYKGQNVTTNKIITEKADLYVLSIDFSHFLKLQDAIELENCAAHSIMHKLKIRPCMKVIDHISTLRVFNQYNHRANYQWCGRTRGENENEDHKGVGYLTFLIRNNPHPKKVKPDGFFVTAYDYNMNQRECLGNTSQWTKPLETKLITDVIQRAQTTSRLTGGKNTNIPVTHYTVTYLYKDNNPAKVFIRGWHAISKDALYLPDVFLENTFDNGTWITPSHTSWPPENTFIMDETLDKLDEKADLRKDSNTEYTLYYTHVMHRSVSNHKKQNTSKRNSVKMIGKGRRNGCGRSRRRWRG